MAIKITKSRDNAGVPSAPQSGIATSTTAPVVNNGGALRDLLINYNAQIQYERNSAKGNPTFAIDTNFDIKNTEPISYTNAGIMVTLADNTNFDTGTTAVIAADCWGIAILCAVAGATGVVTWASSAMSYATEAAAIAALGKITNLCPTSAQSALGYVTVQTASAATWTAGTDALQGGAGGNASADTNYYNDPTLNGTFGGWQIGDQSGTVITQ
jgi:hypothetical protein